MQIFKIVEWRFFDGIVYCKTTIGTFEVWTYGGSIFEEFNAWFCTDYVFELCSTYASEAMDIVTIKKTGTNYRVNFDVKGRWRLVKISKEDAKYKLCKVTKSSMGQKKIPFITTADGRSIRYPHPHIKEHDSIKLNS